MRVIVVGGGVAGLTVAALLGRTGGHSVTVLERIPAYGDAGYGLGLYPLSGAVFNALGVSAKVLERSCALDTY
jgi:2-polyprenyl-6-methoxyphenol hydroxylase and related FAD-dependent oxidoreductases